MFKQEFDSVKKLKCANDAELSQQTDDLKRKLREIYATLTKAFTKAAQTQPTPTQTQPTSSVVELEQEILVDNLAHDDLPLVNLCANMLSAVMNTNFTVIKANENSVAFKAQKDEKVAPRHNLRVEVDRELNVTVRIADIVLVQFNEQSPKRFLGASNYIAETPDVNLTIREDDGFIVKYISSISGTKIDQPILSFESINASEKRHSARYMLQGHDNIVSLMRDIAVGASTVMVLY